MIVLHAWMFFSFRREIATGYPDFTIFYTAGKCILQGRGRQLYDLETQFAIQREFASEVKHRENPLPFNHPPFEALLFAPLARLPYVAAYLVWAVFNIALILGFWHAASPAPAQLARFFTSPATAGNVRFFPCNHGIAAGTGLNLAALSLWPRLLGLGNGTRFCRGIVSWAWRFSSFSWFCPLCLCCWSDVNGEQLRGLSLPAFVLLLVSAAVVGWSGVMAYPGFVLRLSRSGAQAGIDPRDMPNLRGLVAGSLHLAGLPATLLIITLSIALVALAAYWWRVSKLGRQFVLGFSLCLAVTIIISYHLLVHDLSLLILPILLLAELLVAGEIVGRARRILLASLVVLFLTPLYAVLQFSLREMNLMVFAVAMFAAGTAIALTSRRFSKTCCTTRDVDVVQFVNHKGSRRLHEEDPAD